ncbi:MAG: carbamoyltransferase HypF [Thermogutta sp.]|uniref:carbamoyltransferase HypF n=1 Tax=Thermogutta sp. TaxID=1962930 RepID=UPI001997A506|nr:carbamoyltransferase HypF [Thermogutta sp.]MBC7351153.1 carbamoyltransferase HypF [Thermogutta sp.]
MTGVVQGIGFRPFVYRIARKHGLTGWVLNASDGVTLEVQGTGDRLMHFWEDFLYRRPAGVVYETIEKTEIPPLAVEESAFQILPSREGGVRQPTIPPDLATCAECLAELRDPADRRYQYPFINCTHCGPRWSIIEGVPYDRPLTSMKIFAMCRECEREYHNPADRRFHAQPVACPACGPHVELRSASGELLAEREAAVRLAAQAIREGQILALKGLGGFQLICDAGNEVAVQTLRQRKRRPDKPFALMLTEEMLRQACEEPSEAVWRWLRSPAAPIVLLRRRDISRNNTGEPAIENAQSASLPERSNAPTAGLIQDSRAENRTCSIAEGVAPGNPYLGVMLPYTPLHHLLMEAVGRPIVCTSGNLTEEPMAIANDEAFLRLGKIANVFLVHNRPIVRPVDDSVMAEGESGDVFLVRRARGFAPRPIRLAAKGPVVLATGGHLKNVVGLALEDQAILSAHVGDLDNLLAWESHRRAVEDLLRFFQAVPEVVACDLHPDYASTRVAEEFAHRLKAPLFRWQHHVVHFAACLAEWETPRSDPAFDGVLEPQPGSLGIEQRNTQPLPLPLLGVIWDGTGYGIDGTVWGGEFFLFDGRSFWRVAHLRPFPLPGGEVVVREPRRSLLGLLAASGMAERDLEDPRGLLRNLFTESEARILLRSVMRGIQCPRTSSMGRLFDGVAALLGLGARISFEGQAAMALQFAAEKTYFSSGANIGRGSTGSRPRAVGEMPGDASMLSVRPFTRTESMPIVLDWQPLLESLLAGLREGVPRERLALDFHRQLVEAVLAVAEQLKVQGLMFSGGCFHNQLLRRLLASASRARGMTAWFARRVPPGDGGLALGQIWLTRRALRGDLTPGRGGVAENVNKQFTEKN